MKLNNSVMTLALGLLAAGGAYAAGPTAYSAKLGHGEYLEKMSDNGKWAVFNVPMEDYEMYNHYGTLVNLETGEAKDLKSGRGIKSCAAYDVSDDGTVVVGSIETSLSYEQLGVCVDGTWKSMEAPEGTWSGSKLVAVTPDGKYAVGYITSAVDETGDGVCHEFPLMVDIEKMEYVTLPGLPDRNLYGEEPTQVRFYEISADGKKVLGSVDFSYLNYNYSFLYDVENGSYQALGFYKKPNYEHNPDLLEKAFVPLVDNLWMTEAAYFSPNGRYIVFNGYIVEDEMVIGTPEYYCPVLYDTDTEEYVLYDDEVGQGAKAGAVTNDGVVYISTPYDAPYREWYIRSGKYWVSADKILKQVYDTDINKLCNTSDNSTGTVVGVSADELKVALLLSPGSGESAVVTFPERLETVAGSIDLLDSYSVTPALNAHISTLRDITLRFDWDVEVAGQASDVELYNVTDQESVADAIKLQVSSGNPKTVELAFRKEQLADSKTYEVRIPAGTLRIKGDSEKPNKAIALTYYGREAAPVKAARIAPSDGSAVSYFDMSGNPVTISFDTDIAVSSNPQGSFNLVLEDGSLQQLSTLGISLSANSVQIYPVAEQRLYKGNDYRIVIGAGSFTDVQGENPNEEIVINYTGAYERQIPSGNVIFKEDFNDGTWISNLLFFEGDNLNPTSLMQSWGFLNGEQYPWWCVRDDSSETDWSLASHSMYSPAGQSNDWMCTPQIYIPDAQTMLTFQAQSYLNSKTDKLKVVVLESDVLHNYMTEQFIEEFNSKGVVIYDEVVTPGASEEKLADDWTDVGLSLKEFEGKNVYIAFVNQNNDQSAVIVDNIEVATSKALIVSLDMESSLVNAKDVVVNGYVTVGDADLTVNNLTVTLTDAQGKTLDTLSGTDLGLTYGKSYQFTFGKKLPLESGQINSFNVKAESETANVTVRGTVSNLLFEPVKRVVIEEGTGQGCSACPQGHVMLEKLHESFGERVIPVCIHTFNGDNLGSGLDSYTSYLGFNQYPIAAINRKRQGDRFGLYSPMEIVEGKLAYTGTGNDLWWDVVTKELSTPASMDVLFQSYDNSYQTPVYDLDNKQFVVPAAVRYAMDQQNLYHNVLVVVLEHGLYGTQNNGYSGSTDPLIGEWGKGGIYGQSFVRMYEYNDVARAVVGTFNGTSDCFPRNVKAGKVYTHGFRFDVPEAIEDPTNCSAVVMVIDSHTGVVLNSVSAPLVSATSVEELENGMVSATRIGVVDGQIVVSGNGALAAEVYGLNGQKLAQAHGQHSLSMNANGYKGVAIVKVAAEDGVKTAKVMLK